MKIRFIQYLPTWTIYFDFRKLHITLNFDPGIWKFRTKHNGWKLVCVEIGPVFLRYIVQGK